MQFVGGDEVVSTDFEDDALLAERIEAISDDGDDSASDDADGSDSDGGDDGVELSSEGVLSVDTDDREFEDNLLSGTKWSPELLATAPDELIAITHEPDEVSSAAPRILQSPPTRLLIIDIRDETTVFDETLPEEMVSMEWLSDNRLVLGSSEGSVTVIAAN